MHIVASWNWKWCLLIHLLQHLPDTRDSLGLQLELHLHLDSRYMLFLPAALCSPSYDSLSRFLCRLWSWNHASLSGLHSLSVWSPIPCFASSGCIPRCSSLQGSASSFVSVCTMPLVVGWGGYWGLHKLLALRKGKLLVPVAFLMLVQEQPLCCTPQCMPSWRWQTAEYSAACHALFQLFNAVVIE